MYSLSTYFYWLIILLLRVHNLLVYILIRPWRPLVNKVLILILAKYGINARFQEKSAPKLIRQSDGGESNQPEESRQVELVIKDPNLAVNIIAYGTVPLAQAFVDDALECDDIELLLKRILPTILSFGASPALALRDWVYLNAEETPWDTGSGKEKQWVTPSAKELFTRMMPEGSPFSSGYWDFEAELNNTSNAKAITRNMEVLSRKLDLRPGMTVLDLACGTGEFSLYLSKNFDVKVIGLDMCSNDIGQARVKCRNTTAQFFVGDYKFLLQDYCGKFDRVICLHLMEHLGGPKNFPAFFNTLYQYLNPTGKFVLQNHFVPIKPAVRVDLAIRKYILTNVVAPLTSELLPLLDTNKFIVENIESIVTHYEKTLQVYFQNFQKIDYNQLTPETLKCAKLFELAQHAESIGFHFRLMEVWQVVASKIPDMVIAGTYKK